jgi:hypothetical protein
VTPPESARVHDEAWSNIQGGEAAPRTPHTSDVQADETLDSKMDEDHEANRDVEMDFVGLMDVPDQLGSLEPSFHDEISGLLLAQMGSTGKRYRREAATASRRIISEIYSPPRVTELIRRSHMKHILPGFALDLTVNDPLDGAPWDFRVESKRIRARALVRQQRPYLLIGSPQCKEFSTFAPLSAAKTGKHREMAMAKVAATLHVNFVAELYQDQVDGGRYFLHEHPRWATSWELESINALRSQPGVQLVHGDQCKYGAETLSGDGRCEKGDPIRKPTGFMTNAPEVARALSRRCTGTGGHCSRPKGGKHAACTGKHARAAQVYPQGLCRAVLRGVRDQMREDRIIKDGCYGLQVPDDDAAVEKHLRGPAQGCSGRFRDDLTGQVLKDSLVIEARRKELEYFNSKHVWIKVPKAGARNSGGRSPISVRWVDVNKGDDMCPNYRSRLVARQLKAADKSGQSYFAPAPPLEALRTVISLTMTRVGDHRPDWDPVSPTRTQISLIDIKRAYFNAKIDPTDPDTFVQLPPEDEDSTTMVAKLLRHMYGTRMAADGWQEEYSSFLVSLGFRQGDAYPNVSHHLAKSIVTSVHGGDFTSSGPADALDWLEAAIAERYEITVEPRMGPGPNDAKEGRVLNRIIRWCSDRITYEADPRQVERLIAECGLEGAKPVATPGVKPTFTELEDDTPLPAHLTTAFRGSSARANYLSADRIDVQFACKEVCGWMANPSEHAWKALKRICRYLSAAPRLVYDFVQQTVEAVDVYTDTDWAGCPKTRKSTSGGCVMLGHHSVKHWSSTQASISLSSGEAEFAGVIRGAGQGLGYQALLKDLGVGVPLRVWTDSSAAIGICGRQGLGKLRHLDTHTLWIQQAVRTKRVDLRKVPGDQNPADLLTKHSISRHRLEELTVLFGCRYLGGRAASAPQMRKGESSRVTMANADQDLGIEDDTVGNVERMQVMPHLSVDKADLDRLYPSLEAPESDRHDDLHNDARDGVYQHGLQIAEEIRAQSESQGRRRRPAPTPTSCSTSSSS